MLYLSTKTENLRFVFSLFRHGARAPYSLNTKTQEDLFGNKWERQSQLTGIGMRQHYLLGVKNKEKYFSRLNITEKYLFSEIYVFATETDRTIMSAYSQLFGMFPPGSAKELNNEQLKHILPPIKGWDFAEMNNKIGKFSIIKGINPFPVKIFDNYSRYFDLNNPINCPKVQNFINENEKNPKWADFLNSFIKDYGNSILKIIGKDNNPEFLKDSFNVYLIFDAFESNYVEGRDLSKFTTNGINIETFKKLTDEFMFVSSYNYYFGDTMSWVGRFSMSPIFENLIRIIDRRILIDKSGEDHFDSNNPKILMYSGHDMNIAALLTFLKFAFPDKSKLYSIPFASSVNFELIKIGNFKSENLLKFGMKTDEDNYSLNILFNDENIFGSQIKYSEFKKIIKENLVPYSDIEKFCGFDNKNHKNVPEILIEISILILGILIIILSLYIYKIKKGKIDQTKPMNFSNTLNSI